MMFAKSNFCLYFLQVDNINKCLAFLAGLGVNIEGLCAKGKLYISVTSGHPGNKLSVIFFFLSWPCTVNIQLKTIFLLTKFLIFF